MKKFKRFDQLFEKLCSKNLALEALEVFFTLETFQGHF